MSVRGVDTEEMATACRVLAGDGVARRSFPIVVVSAELREGEL